MASRKKRHKRCALKLTRRTAARAAATVCPPMLPPWADPALLRPLSAGMARLLTEAAAKARALADGGHTPQAVTDAVLRPLGQVYGAMDELTTRTQQCAAGTPTALACAPGCHWCCRLYVEVGPLEAFAIADLLQLLGSHDDIFFDQVRARLQEESHRFALEGLDSGPRLCALLTSHGTCSIYPARPVACRDFGSLSQQACQAHYTQERLDEGYKIVHLDALYPLRMAAIAGQHLAGQAPPLPQTALPQFYEMQSAVLRILETPNALVRYLHGEDIFAGCARHSPTERLQQTGDLLQLHVPTP